MKFSFSWKRIDGFSIVGKLRKDPGLRDCTLEAVEIYHQSHVFEVKYGFKKGGGFLEDLCDTDIKDLYFYTKKYKF